MNADEAYTADSPGEVLFQPRQRLPFDVEVLQLGELLSRKAAEDLWKLQRIHFNALMLIESGTSSHYVDFEQYPAKAGHLFIIPAMHVQAFAADRRLHGSLAIFTQSFLEYRGVEAPQVLEAGLSLLRCEPLIVLGTASFTLARRAFRTLTEYQALPPTRYSIRATVAAFDLLTFTLATLPEVAASRWTHDPEDGLTTEFLTLLETHFRTEHHANAYADLLHVSLRTLDRHVVKARSITPRQLISARLLLEAKRMLTDEDVLIKNVAFALGFAEAQNFSRFFRAHAGMSPEEFRRSIGEGN